MNNFRYSSRLKNYSRRLRNNLTYGEVFLWSKLRKRQMRGYKFRRQFPIENYIADFYCNELKLIIEIDGSSHDESKYKYDLKRQKRLETLGYKVIRFTETETLRHIDDVLQSIENFINGEI